jgi:hypothetical protein
MLREQKDGSLHPIKPRLNHLRGSLPPLLRPHDHLLTPRRRRPLLLNNRSPSHPLSTHMQARKRRIEAESGAGFEELSRTDIEFVLA